MASKERNTLRFAVGTPAQARTAVWRLWTSKDDVYLSTRVPGQSQIFKVSLHESGNWRIGWTEDAAIKQPSGDRAVLKWRRPVEFTPGWTCGCTLVVPATDLHSFPALGAEGARIEWVPAPKPGRSNVFGLLIARPGAFVMSVRLDGLKVRTVGRVKLANGSGAWIVWAERPMQDAEHELLAARRSITVNMTGDPGRVSATAFEVQPTVPPVIIDVPLGGENIAWPGKA